MSNSDVEIEVDEKIVEGEVGEAEIDIKNNVENEIEGEIVEEQKFYSNETIEIIDFGVFKKYMNKYVVEKAAEWTHNEDEGPSPKNTIYIKFYDENGNCHLITLIVYLDIAWYMDSI